MFLCFFYLQINVFNIYAPNPYLQTLATPVFYSKVIYSKYQSGILSSPSYVHKLIYSITASIQNVCLLTNAFFEYLRHWW